MGPDVKKQAEMILAKLRVPASTVINRLYKQIIMTRSIPFSLSVPAAPLAWDEIDTVTFNTTMKEGLTKQRRERDSLWIMLLPHWNRT